MRALERGSQSVVITFDPHPSHVLRGGKTARASLLTPLDEKLRLLAGMQIDMALVLPFDEGLRTLTASRFAQEILHDAMHAVEVHEGETFRFGHRAEADLAGLSRLGKQLGFEVKAYPPLMRRGAAVSSSRIRSLVQGGKVEQARALLGRPFSLFSTPAAGRGFGTRYAVPTINLKTPCELIPAHGVYVTTLRVGEGADARTFAGVTNAGNRPTFGADSYAIESHLFDFEPLPLTAETPLQLSFLHRLRGEQRFDSPELLKAQIGRDIACAERYLSLGRSLRAIA